MLTEQPLTYYQQLAQIMIGQPVIDMKCIGGGRNSRAYKTICPDINYVFKVYKKNEMDQRDRLGTEFSSLRFLEDCGLNNVPKAIVADPENNCAVFEYINGGKIANGDITDQDIDQAVSFLNILEGHKQYAVGKNITAASEACFSFSAIWENIYKRCKDLSISVQNEKAYPELSDYFQKQFNPAMKQIEAWYRRKLAEASLVPGAELELAARTLSPSDFGFHNTLRKPDGELVFLDFEYFGWDDPAKMVVDMLHHPGMSLSMSQKRHFVRGILSHFYNYPKLMERIEIVYPLYGLKWCLILLNEFLPARLLLRTFAGVNTGDARSLQAEQLNKSRLLLNETLIKYDDFPYFN
jgi:thiamine kinase-like enzyme